MEMEPWFSYVRWSDQQTGTGAKASIGQIQGDEAWRLQLLIDSVIDYAIYMIDLNGRILSWNSGAARLKG